MDPALFMALATVAPGIILFLAGSAFDCGGNSYRAPIRCSAFA
jgi:hypothetical protein